MPSGVHTLQNSDASVGEDRSDWTRCTIILTFNARDAWWAATIRREHVVVAESDRIRWPRWAWWPWIGAWKRRRLEDLKRSLIAELVADGWELMAPDPVHPGKATRLRKRD